MWKLVLAECRYNWISICTAFAFIIFLGTYYMYFNGSMPVVSTMGLFVLAIPASKLGTLNTKEKRLGQTLHLPIELRKVGIARILTPSLMVITGITVLWLFILLFSAASASLKMVGMTFVPFGFLILVIAGHALISDLKYFFTGRFGKILIYPLLAFLYILVLVIIVAVILIYYRDINATTQSVFYFSFILIILGIAVSVADIFIFERRRTFIE